MKGLKLCAIAGATALALGAAMPASAMSEYQHDKMMWMHHDAMMMKMHQAKKMAWMRRRAMMMKMHQHEKMKWMHHDMM